MSTTSRPTFWSKRSRPLAAFLLVAVVSLALFVPTFQGHTAIINAHSIEATPVDYQLADSEDAIEVSMQVTNPTGRPIDVFAADVEGYADETRVARVGTATFQRSTITAGETTTLTVTLNLVEPEQAKAAVKNDELRVSGQLRARINGEMVTIDVSRRGGQS